MLPVQPMTGVLPWVLGQVTQLPTGLIHNVVRIGGHQLLEGGGSAVEADGANCSSCRGSYRGAGVCQPLQQGQQRRPQKASI